MPRAQTIREAVLECMRIHDGGPLKLKQIEEWVKRAYPKQWAEVYADVADLVIGKSSSSYMSYEQCLHRVSRGVYQLDQAFLIAPSKSASHTRDQDIEIPDNTTDPDDAGTNRVTHQKISQMPPPVWVPGAPSVWGTPGEAPWRETLGKCIPPPSNELQADGVVLRYTVESMERAGQPFDLDNMCEPVFRVLVNGMGYFRGARPNIRWWAASRELGNPEGCSIAFCTRSRIELGNGRVVLVGVYRGDVPTSATDTCFADWIEATQPDTGGALTERCAVALMFGNDRVNIANVSTGPTKPIIDNLYPIVGGTAGDPEDWRIDRLFVSKGHSGLSEDQILIMVSTLNTDSHET